jgi:hypothetical protein
MHKSATNCNETVGKWCKNKHGASKIIDTLETYHRVQPLQHRLAKLWTFSGLGDSSRVSEDLMEKKELDKQVRALTTLTKDHEVAELAASYFDSQHPLPAVCFYCLYSP